MKRNRCRRLVLGGLLAVTVAGAEAGTDFTDLELVPVLDGLTSIVDIANAGDGRLFLSTQGGEILVWDGATTSTFIDLSPLMGAGFEGGIKSIAFHPTYPDPGFFFVHYSDTGNASVVARYSVSEGDPNVADPGSGAILISVPQKLSIHRGGQVQFGADGFLYIGLGDGGPQTDTECHAQRPDTLQGKLLRLDVDQSVDTPPHYGIPADNPFGGAGEPPAEVWALGLRQPWKFSFDRQTGDLFIADVGQDQREEIDFQAAGAPGGANYGWRIMEGTVCFDPDPIDPDCPPTTPSCDDPELILPILEYGQGGGDCSVTGGYVYRGPEAPELVGHYVYGDWCTGNLWAAEDPGGGWTPTLLPVSLPQVTSFGEDGQGRLFLTDGVTIYRLRAMALFEDGFESGDTSGWN